MARYYIYNEETLSYEAVSIPLKVQLRRLLTYALLGVVLSTAAIYTFSYFFETPRSVLMRRQNDAMQMRYELLMQRFRQTDAALTDLLQRDNKVYRSIFEADIIPLSVRESGMGGAGRYELLLAKPQTKIVAEASLLMDKITKKAYIQSKSLDEISRLASQMEQMIECIPRIQPLNLSNPKIRVSAAFGPRIDPIYRVQSWHDGIDFAGPVGIPIYATGEGRVIRARHDFSPYGYGNVVDIDHGFGYKTRYAHLSEIKVELGEAVQRGQLIALLGNTGKSTGPHLHYEVQYKGQTVNPINFFSDDINAEEYNKIIEALSGKTAGLATDWTSKEELGVRELESYK